MASEYGWSLDHIYNRVYFDELYSLTKEIKKRKISDYRIQLAIVQNPHLEPKHQKALWENLVDRDDLPEQDVFNEQEFDMLISVMKQGKAIEIKT